MSLIHRCLQLLMTAALLALPALTIAMDASDPLSDTQGRDPLGRDTPRGTVEGFLRALDVGDDARASEYLDLRNLPSRITQSPPEQLARGLSIVLERGAWIDLEMLSESPEGLAATMELARALVLCCFFDISDFSILTFPWREAL